MKNHENITANSQHVVDAVGEIMDMTNAQQLEKNVENATRRITLWVSVDRELKNQKTRKPRIDSVETAGKQDGDGDSNDDELDEFFVYSMETTADASDPWIVPLEINNNIMAFKIDTGSDVDVLSYEEFKTLQNKTNLKQSKIKLKKSRQSWSCPVQL